MNARHIIKSEPGERHPATVIFTKNRRRHFLAIHAITLAGDIFWTYCNIHLRI
jgi:hypothetical protein